MFLVVTISVIVDGMERAAPPKEENIPEVKQALQPPGGCVFPVRDSVLLRPLSFWVVLFPSPQLSCATVTPQLGCGALLLFWWCVSPLFLQEVLLFPSSFSVVPPSPLLWVAAFLSSPL